VHPYINTQAKVAPNFGMLGQLMSANGAIGCHYIMVEADIHLRLLPTSIIDIYNVIESLVCLGHLWSENDAITSWLRLTSTSDWFPHP
jgi:hypothetical protein